MLRRANILLRYARKLVRDGLSEGMTWAHGSPRPGVRKTLYQPFKNLYKGYSLLSQLMEGSAYLVKGASAVDGLPLAVGFAGIWDIGERNTLPFFEHLLFKDGTAERKEVCRFPLWQLRRRVDELASQADLICVNADRPLLWHPDQGEWVIGPTEFRMVFDYPEGQGWEGVEQLLRSQRANLKKLRRAGFTYETSHAVEDFSLFYHRYYLPTVQNRYKDYGDINTENGLRKVFQKNGVILFVKDQQGEAVSAEFDVVKHGVLYGLLSGVRDGNPDFITQGALAACYYFSFHYGFQHGFRRHDAGVCQPFLSDGVLQHKMMWGYRPLPNDWRPHYLLLWSPRSEASAVSWLKANPILPQYASWGGAEMQAFYSCLEARKS